MNKFLKATILGGIAAVLPLTILIVFFRWVFVMVKDFVFPIVEQYEKYESLNNYEVIIAYVIVVVAIIFIVFLMGLFIQTRIGRFFKNAFEKKYLMKIPGYKITKETVEQFFGKNKTFFSEVVIVELFNSGTLMTGFVTDNKENYTTVFVPTGPNPTSGNIYHVENKNVHKTDVPVEVAMKSIISCGAGSDIVLESYLKGKKE